MTHQALPVVAPETVPATWAEVDDQASQGDHRQQTYYPIGDGPERVDIAQRLHKEGLIYEINRLVLHPRGLSLGVHCEPGTTVDFVSSGVLALFFNEAKDGEPYEYTKEQIARNEAKLVRAREQSA